MATEIHLSKSFVVRRHQLGLGAVQQHARVRNHLVAYRYGLCVHRDQIRQPFRHAEFGCRHTVHHMPVFGCVYRKRGPQPKVGFHSDMRVFVDSNHFSVVRINLSAHRCVAVYRTWDGPDTQYKTRRDDPNDLGD